MAHTIAIGPEHPLTFETLQQLLHSGTKIELSPEARKRIQLCRDYLDQKIAAGTGPVYGINTGFGSLYNISIPESDLEQLQTNLVMSHACGTGDEVPAEIVRLMLVLKIQSLAYGHSAVQLETVERLADFFNNNMLPVVYQQGSLGASGDLAPLAHLCLPLLGMGEVTVNGKKQAAAEALKAAGLSPVRLKSKEGLALLNGTQFMSAYGSWCVLQAQHLAATADTVAALSLESYDGRIDPFHESLHRIRPHAGQVQTAANMRRILNGSKLIAQAKKHVQDPYSFRCIPQVHGASRDAIAYCATVIATEINSVTDNPTVFPDEDLLLSGGNFHGQPLALALDFLALALSELGSISERRTYLLISGQRDLPMFLVAKPGLNSGFMIPQYTAASIASQNKQLCMPASADSIVSSNGQEDHVSMGANAATKCRLVVNNLERILAIELLTAAQALDFRKAEETSPVILKMHTAFRSEVAFMDVDRILYTEISKSVSFLQSFNFGA